MTGECNLTSRVESKTRVGEKCKSEKKWSEYKIGSGALDTSMV